MSYLARREHTQLELGRKLRGKGFADELIDAVLQELAQQGLQSDSRFAEQYIHVRVQSGHGPTRIVMELQAKGVDASLARQLLDEGDQDWLATIRAVHEKKFAGHFPTKLNERAKQMRFLQYRGFTTTQINQLMSGDEH